MQLRNKKNKAKSLSQLVNEQWDESVEGPSSVHRDRFHEDGFGDDEAVVEDYEVVPSDPFQDGDGDGDAAGKGGYQHFVGTRKRAREADSSKKSGVSSKGEPQLRRRGPLDATLSSGKYAATPRNVEAAMDDLFGGLDMADLDEEANEIVSDAEVYTEEESDEETTVEGHPRRTKKKSQKGSGKKRRATKDEDEEGSDAEEEGGQRKKTKKKSKKVKDLTEAQYIAYLEEKAQQRGGRKQEGEAGEEEEEEDEDKRRLSFPSLPKERRGARRGLDPGLATSSETAEEMQEMEENDILSQIASLRSQHIRVVQSGPTAGGERGGSGDAVSGEAQASSIRHTVKHFLLLHSQLLRLRVKLQPMVMRAVRLPQYYALPLFTGSGQEALFPHEKTAASSELGSGEGAERNDGGKRKRQKKSTSKEKKEKGTEEIHVQEDASITTHTTDLPSSEEVRQQCATAKSDLQYLKKEMKLLLSGLYQDAIQMQPNGPKNTSRTKKSLASPSAASPTVCPDIHMLSTYHRHVREHANTCLAFWGNRLSPSPSFAASSALKAIHQPLPTQIEALLQNKSRLRVKVQKNRSHVSILGHPEHVRAASWFYKGALHDVEAGEAKGSPVEDPSLSQDQREAWKAQRALAISNGDADEEIYDDGDFIRELARRGGADSLLLQHQLQEDRQAMLENSSTGNGSGASSRELGGASGSKKGFHRLTKGKSLDFTPRPKLVGFMVADSWENLYPPRNEVMVRSLLQ